jgi:hypothetical protein
MAVANGNEFQFLQNEANLLEESGLHFPFRPNCGMVGGAFLQSSSLLIYRITP